MNVVAMIGNLATDPELKTTSGGKSVCTFRLAVSRPGKDSVADFFTVVAWERQAEVIAEYLAIGRRVAVEGRLHHSTWDAADGSGKRSKVEIIAHRVEMLGKPSDAPANTDQTSELATVGAPAEDDDIPF